MSADRNRYQRWGSSGSAGDRDDKSQAPPSSGTSSNYQRYHRQHSSSSSSSTYHGSQPNRATRDSYSGSGSSASGNSYYDYGYKGTGSNRSYNSHNYRHPSRTSKNGDSYVGYHRNQGRDSALNASSSFEPDRSETSSSFKSNKPNGYGYYERRNQRFSGSANYRRNPEEYADHYYPQRDRRSSLISSTSGSSKPNRLESTKQSNDERSVSPLNSTDPYSESPKVSEGYQRKSRPSLIPSNFKDDEQNDDEDDDYEIESALKNIPRPAIRQDSYDDKSIMTDDNKRPSEVSNEIQERISEKLPLTLEHKEELDEGKGTLTRQSSEESTYEPEQSVVKDEGDDATKLVSTTQEAKEDSKSEDDKMDLDESDKEESDNYEPEADIESDGGKSVLTAPKKLEVEEEKYQEVSVKKPIVHEDEEVKVESSKKKIESKTIVPLHKIESCIFPMTKPQLRLWELKNHEREDIIDVCPYLLKRPIKNFNDYPFFSRNLLVHEQGFKLKLLEKLSVLKGTTFDRKLSLWNEYSHRADDWNERCADMENQLRELYPNKEAEAEDLQQNQEPEAEHHLQSSSRRGRYHGDTVRSEAEFLEILKNLEKEKESDPLYKAELLAAKIPDMILNPVYKHVKLLDVNNLVLDKEEWAKRINTDRIDTFTRKEHEMFCEAFLSYPKRFGRISAFMGGLRTPEECVLHYYKTKKQVTDYKQLLASKKKRNRKGGKNNRRISKSKTVTATNTSAPNTPNVETPADSGGEEKELVLENFIPKEVAEEVYTETGRRRRAAAPVFDSLKGPKPNDEQDIAKEEDERKRSLDNTSANETQDEDAKSNKVPPKKKARAQKPKKRDEVKTDNVAPSTAEHHDDGKGAARVITSYWSVKDINQFATLIGEFGTQWSSISERMKTKSTTMVRNYYLKNADSHGWRSIAEAADRKNEAYQNYPGVIDNNNGQHQQQMLKKPPLGVFSSHGDLPSNVNVSNQHQQDPNVLPSVKSLAPFPKPLVSLQPFPSPHLPYNTQHEQPQQYQSPLPPAGGSTSRSNPFSISNLLNPSEDSKPSQPTQSPAPAPQMPSFTKSNREVYAPYNNSSTNGGVSSVMSMLNREDSKPFNPLSTLVAVADNSSNSQNVGNPSPGQLSNYDGQNFGLKKEGFNMPPIFNHRQSGPEHPATNGGYDQNNIRRLLVPTTYPPLDQSEQSNNNNNINDNNNANFPRTT